MRLLIPHESREQEAAINFTATGDNTVVAGVAGQQIRVYRIFFVVSAATTITFKDGAGTNLTGAISMLANGSFVLDFDFDNHPWFTTSVGNAFVINQSGTAQVSGRVYFTQS
jgi:hypothetical protein